MVDAGALMVDVREPDEWQQGHAPDASLLPMGQLRARRAELASDRTVVVVCRSGGRSAAVTASLRAWGLDAFNVASGLPVITPDADRWAHSPSLRLPARHDQ